VEAYKEIVPFKEGRHHMYIQAKRDPNEQWLMKRDSLTRDEVGQIMEYLEDDWKTPVPETENKETQSSKNDPKEQ
jgi:hypothetical protein